MTTLWDDKIQIVEYLAGDLDLEIKYIQPWHLRISREGNRTLDYFPKSGRATWLSSGRWFEIEDIEKFLQEHFKQATV